MTEQEALRDLASSEGWAYLKAYAASELSITSERIFQLAGDTDPVIVGWRVKSHQALVAAMRQLLTWPERRADELDKREGRDYSGEGIVDTRGKR